MKIDIRAVEYQDIETMRELYRHEANCQIIHDSAPRRRMADPYLITVDGRIAGYGTVWNKHEIGRLSEFYTVPAMRSQALRLYRELLEFSKATHLEAQTNMPLMLMMFYDCAQNISTESILFEDALTSNLTCPNGHLRPARPEDAGATGPTYEPDGSWVIEANGIAVASGDFLCHYNPPYGDIYMSVAEAARRCGYGSYLVQELKRICYESGKRPAARCNPTNIASRKTLQKAGFLPCARLLVGEIAPRS